MRKIVYLILLVVINGYVFSQNTDFFADYLSVIEVDDYQKTLSWLEKNSNQYKEYMDGCPKNIATVAYNEKKYNAMKATVDFDKKLLTIFIGSCAGGHPSTPPTIFECIKNNDQKYVEYYLSKGVPINITWEIIANLPENLYSMSISEEMRLFLKKKGCPEYVQVNNYKCETVDNHINVRSLPGISGKVLFQVNNNEIGELQQITSYEETISGNKNRWYYISFLNGKSGWVFGQFVHVLWLDGM